MIRFGRTTAAYSARKNASERSASGNDLPASSIAACQAEFGVRPVTPVVATPSTDSASGAMSVPARYNTALASASMPTT